MASEASRKKAEGLVSDMEGESWERTSNSSWLAHRDAIAAALDEARAEEKAISQEANEVELRRANAFLGALRQSHARLLAAAKNADCCCGARECEGLRAAVAEAEALS